MSKEIQEMQELLAELPEIVLPESLTAEALFARMDAGEIAPTTTPARMDRVLDITRRLRPVLSYAAVFILMVAVYYGTGMDRAAGSYDSLAAAPMVANDMAVQPRMATPQAEEAPQLMMAPTPETGAPAKAEGYSLAMEETEEEADRTAAPDALLQAAPQAAATAALRMVAVVQVGEDVVLELDLADTPDGEIPLPEALGFAMTLEVKEGSIRIAQADCADQQCVKAGFVSQENAMVCCLRDEVLITLVKK